MPFSREINVLKKNYAIAENCLMMFLTFIIAAIHFISSTIGTLAVNIYIITILIINIFLFKLTFKNKN